jgi:two-component system chemotaxis response regulator CheY
MSDTSKSSQETSVMSRTLLVTDDAIIIREIIKDIAISVGWEIAGEATNGREAAERYVELRPDACTLDLVMPKYDGLYALREIIKFDPDARVTVVSALNQKKVLVDALRAGAADFVVKPFDRNLLVETLEQMVPSRTAAGSA